MPLLKFPEPFLNAFITNYILLNDVDQDTINELIPQYFAAEFDPTIESNVLIDTLRTILAVKLAADNHRRIHQPVPSEALLILTMVGERQCTSPLHH